MQITSAPPQNAITRVKEYLLTLQHSICQSLEALDCKQFLEDKWTKTEGGEGLTKIIMDGNIFNQAGVNFSHVWGDSLPSAATTTRPELVNHAFNAMGVSLVIHPENPYVPTTHANVRFFIAEKDGSHYWWFGGGFDLTPYYGFKEDCIHWHQTAKAACDPFGEALYPRLKKSCDEYFFLKHRQEPRGIGGLFFDDFNEGGFENSFSFLKSIGDHFIHAYLPILLKRHQVPYGEREKNFQRYRRGRYVEFNLIYDRGTLFGLQSGGRTESILMSLPPEVHWKYNWQPEKGSAEEELYTIFLPAQDWI